MENQKLRNKYYWRVFVIIYTYLDTLHVCMRTHTHTHTHTQMYTHCIKFFILSIRQDEWCIHPCQKNSMKLGHITYYSISQLIYLSALNDDEISTLIN